MGCESFAGDGGEVSKLDTEATVMALPPWSSRVITMDTRCFTLDDVKLRKHSILIVWVKLTSISAGLAENMTYLSAFVVGLWEFPGCFVVVFVGLLAATVVVAVVVVEFPAGAFVVVVFVGLLAATVIVVIVDFPGSLFWDRQTARQTATNTSTAFILLFSRNLKRLIR